MAVVFISIGSNIEKEKNIPAGLTALEKLFGSIDVSSLYECAPVGFVGDLFFNLVVKAQTNLSVADLASKLREIEFAHGRDFNAKKMSSRTLDLDVLLYDDLILNSPVQIPRDEITKNAFVLWPLAELAGELVHPQLKLSYGQLWQAFDRSKQTIKQLPFLWQQGSDEQRLTTSIDSTGNK